MIKEINPNDVWCLSPEAREFIYKDIPRSSLIVEFGSGRGSLTLAEDGYTIYTFENDKQWLNKYKHPNLYYFHAPLVEFLDNHKIKWYEQNIVRSVIMKNQNNIKLIIVDGPIGRIGREGILKCREIFNKLTCPFLFDDTNRHAELDIATRFARLTNRKIATITGKEKDFSIVI